MSLSGIFFATLQQRETSKTNRTSQNPPCHKLDTHSTEHTKEIPQKILFVFIIQHFLSFSSVEVSISRFDVHCRYAGVRGDHSKLLSQSDKSMSSSSLQFHRKTLHLIAIDPHAELRTPQSECQKQREFSQQQYHHTFRTAV